MTFEFTELDYSTMYTIIKEFALIDKSEAYKNGDKAEVVGYKDARLGKAYINIAFILDAEGWIYTIGVFKDAYCEEAICLMQVITEFDGSHPVVVPLDEEQYISCAGIPEVAIMRGARRL